MLITFIVLVVVVSTYLYYSRAHNKRRSKYGFESGETTAERLTREKHDAELATSKKKLKTYMNKHTSRITDVLLDYARIRELEDRVFQFVHMDTAVVSPWAVWWLGKNVPAYESDVIAMVQVDIEKDAGIYVKLSIYLREGLPNEPELKAALVKASGASDRSVGSVEYIAMTGRKKDLPGYLTNYREHLSSKAKCFSL